MSRSCRSAATWYCILINGTAGVNGGWLCRDAMPPASRRLTHFIWLPVGLRWRAMQIKMSDYNRVSVGPVAELRILAETRHAPPDLHLLLSVPLSQRTFLPSDSRQNDSTA